MAVDRKQDAALALHRFGMGPRGGSIAAIATDPRGALMAELDRPGAGQISHPDLMSGGDAGRAMFAFQQERRAARLAQRAAPNLASASSRPAATPDGAGPGAPNASSDMSSTDMSSPDKSMSAPANAGPPPAAGPGVPQQLYLAEVRARTAAALDSDIGFVERLVWFWSNHFCVSGDKGPQVRSLCGAFEREAIRPHILGRFGDMLLAVESHPAMLFYLDNVRSTGPQSIAGRNRGAGLNENLAREIMELHTLGVRTVYTQDDVTNFAKVITGWSIVPFKQDPVHGGEFTFNPRLHEPGAQVVIGKAYPEGEFDQGRAVLADIARYPATAKHIAGKFATHFIADTPPPALVDRLAKRFLETHGDLKELAKSLISSEEAWNTSRGKLKRPGEWIVGALRTVDAEVPDIRPVIQAHNVLGEPLWRPPAPKGFSDDSADWMPGLAERLDVANQLARRVGDLVEPDAAVDAALGPLASEETRQTVKRAESRPQALALLLMAPEFQRR
jgi:uncharacterized protein (DUF1800 family)